MNAKTRLMRRPERLRLPICSLLFILVLLTTVNPVGSKLAASAVTSERAGEAVQDFSPAAADTCAAATVISPGSLPFTEDSTTTGASNDVDPGFGTCAQ